MESDVISKFRDEMGRYLLETFVLEHYVYVMGVISNVYLFLSNNSIIFFLERID